MAKAKRPSRKIFFDDDAMEAPHQPVLLQEAMAGLMVASTGIFIDATFGRGGHTKAILKRLDDKSILIGIDKDQQAIDAAKQLHDNRLIIRQGSFIKLKPWVEELNLTGKVNGILLDLGVSSPQLDNKKRGFSFLQDGPLDMRMDQQQTLNAADWLKTAKEQEIAQVLRQYGEERFSKRIAHAIVKEQTIEPITTTGRLAEIVARANPKWEAHKHPATRTFQAIRILINNELQEIAECLEQSLEVLTVGGRLAIISFHSLEDRVVKKFMQKHTSGGLPSKLPIIEKELFRRLRKINGAIPASPAEIQKNPRARSARLRIMEKL